ncbi:MAG: hypothetical protein ACI9CU_001377, partial [Polaribacter sp.]
SKTNWEKRPSKVGFGRLKALLISAQVSSKETPNMTNPRIKLRANRLLGSKFMTIESSKI